MVPTWAIGLQERDRRTGRHGTGGHEEIDLPSHGAGLELPFLLLSISMYIVRFLRLIRVTKGQTRIDRIKFGFLRMVTELCTEILGFGLNSFGSGLFGSVFWFSANMPTPSGAFVNATGSRF